MNKFFTYILNLYFRIPFFRQFLWSIICLFVFSVVIVIITQNRNVTSQTVGWERSFNLSTYNVIAKNVNAASRGKYIAVVYEGKVNKEKGIYSTVSFDGGSSFLPPIKIAELVSKVSSNPHVAVSSNGKITVMWHKFVAEENTNRIFYSTSKDLGANWKVPKKLNIGYETEMLPKVFYDDRDVLHLFFHGTREDAFNLYHAHSVDGENFEITGAILEVTESLLGAFFPAIHLSGDTFSVVWQGRSGSLIDNLFIIRSENYGRSWSSIEQITRTEGSNASPSVLMHNRTLYIAYQNNDKKSWGIKLLKGIGRDRIWKEPVNISSTNVNCYSPQIIQTGDNLMVLWYDARDGTGRIYSRKYNTRSEKVLDEEAKITTGKRNAKSPVAISLGKKVVAFWEEQGQIIGKSSDVHVDPPVVFSVTHPNGVWSRNPIAQIQWKIPKDDSGVVAYWTLITKKPDLRPFVDPPIKTLDDGAITKQIIPNLNDGITYFHIRAEDGAGNVSRTVHYKIQVSINPLPMPVVLSTTHPQGKSVKSINPEIRWAIDDSERLKGFYYTLTRDYTKRPDTFTTDFNKLFQNLGEGRYFFRIAAVDKTNQIGRIATYDFVVGKAEAIDPEILKKIAHDKTKIKIKKVVYDKKVHPVMQIPSVTIQFPFDLNDTVNKSKFSGIVTVKNIPEKNVIGYSIFVNKEKVPFPQSINLKKKVIHIKDLKDGRYYIGIKAKYFKTVKGRKQYYWTRDHISSVRIELSPALTHIDSYIARLLSIFRDKIGVTSIFIFSISVSIVTFGFGRKISFKAKSAKFRFANLYRRLLNR